MSGSLPENGIKRGLVLAGGGALGAWQIGVLRAFLEKGVKFDAVLGFSAGALNGAAWFLGRVPEAVERWRNPVKILRFSPRLFPFSIFSDRPVWDSLDYAHDDAAARARGRCRLVVASVPVARLKRVYGVFDPAAEGTWDAPLAKHLVASSAIPFVFPPVPLEHRGERHILVDGGCPSAEPFSVDALGACHEIVMVEMVRPDELDRAPSGWAEKLDLGSRKLARRLMDEAEATAHARPEKPRVRRLWPSQRLEATMLHFEKAPMSAAEALGYRDGLEFLSRPA